MSLDSKAQKHKEAFSRKVSITEEIPVVEEYDVLILGAGPSGIIAALAAAEDGQRVGVVEYQGFAGGNLTIGLPLNGFLGQKGNQVIKGLPDAFVQRLRTANGATEHQRCPLHMSLTFADAEITKTVALEMLVEAGVELWFHIMFSGVVKQGNRLTGVILQTKEGRKIFTAKTYIDCTGDADVAYAAGVPTHKGDDSGRPEDGTGLQPPTVMFCVAGADANKLRFAIAEHPEIYDIDFIPQSYYGEHEHFVMVGMRTQVNKARADGMTVPTDRTLLVTSLRSDEIWVNMTRKMGVDATNPRSVSDAEIDERLQIDAVQKFLVKYIPGFENSYIKVTSPFIGVRETRRIVGQYVMTRDDILACRRFDDAIAVASYPIDMHHPDDEDCTLEWCGDCYDIPYRSLLPLGVDNLIVAGRSISCTHEAMAAIRVMPICMAMGEAAGRAAAMCASQGIGFADLDVSALQKELRVKGAYLQN